MSSAALLQTPAPSADTGAAGYFRVILVLAGLLLLCYAALKYAAPRLNAVRRRSPGGQLEVVDSLVLEPRRSLQIVRVGNRHVLVASSETGIRVVGDVDWDESHQHSTGNKEPQA